MPVRVSITVVVVLAALATLQSQSQSPDASTSTAAVVEAAAAYVAKYEQQLTSVVAMEVSTQRLLRTPSTDPGAPRTRALKSEMFFMFSPAEHEWMAVRDVNEVDGKRVENPPDLKKAIETVPLVQIARTLKSYSSRYNIGTIVRNFGEPTLSLLVLDANHRANFGFASKGVERRSGAVLVTLYFREHGSETLLRDVSGASVQSEGELVVEAMTGRIRRAVLKARLGAVQAELTTTYQPDAGLDLWVPSVFSEQYDENSSSSSVGTAYRGTLESILCEAKYSNFRRFQAFGQIKK